MKSLVAQLENNLMSVRRIVAWLCSMRISQGYFSLKRKKEASFGLSLMIGVSSAYSTSFTDALEVYPVCSFRPKDDRSFGDIMKKLRLFHWWNISLLVWYCN